MLDNGAIFGTFKNDSAGSIIVTIGLPDPKCLVLKP